MKIVISFISILLIIVNSVLLLFQYQVYSSSLDANSESFFYEQEIEVKLKNNKMLIKQHFTNLPETSVTISWPLPSEERSCEISNGDGCNRLTEDMTSFAAGDKSKQSISYELPMPEGLVDGDMISDLFAKLDGGGVSYTTLHITDELKRGGMWVSGLPSVGNVSLDLIEYSLASGSGNVNELYWQQNVLPIVYEDDYYTFYSNSELTKEMQMQLTDIHLQGSEHISVLFEDDKSDSSSSRIIFSSSESMDSVGQELVVENVKTMYGLEKEQTLLAEVISSYLLSHPVGSEKAEWMYETLNNYFTSEQLNVWNDLLEEEQNDLNAKKLDGMLSEVIALKTSFFTFNSQLEEEFFPLLFEDSRIVYLNELQQEEIKVLFKDGRVLYAVEPLIPTLGYTVNDTNEGLYIQNATRAFRFPVQEPFYVFNEKRYEALSEPFEKIGSDYYVEETWMIRLFLLEVEKQEKRINITQSALF